MVVVTSAVRDVGVPPPRGDGERRSTVPAGPIVVALRARTGTVDVQGLAGRVAAVTAGWDVHIMFVDDTPGRSLSKRPVAPVEGVPDGHVSVIRPSTRSGWSLPVWAGQRGYAWAVEMAADGSHLPEHLPALMTEAAYGADMVIGSRYLDDQVPAVGSVSRWRVLSRLGNAYTRWLTGTHIQDSTSAYRVYRTVKFQQLVPARSRWGRALSEEAERAAVTVAAVRAHLDVREVPICAVVRAPAGRPCVRAVTDTITSVTRAGVEGRSRQARRAWQAWLSRARRATRR